jgi:predicted phosphohydrolase
MKIWAIGDLHLSYGNDGQLRKPMDIFGSNWKDHDLKIKRNWEENVAPEDYVMIPGDFSWAMNLEEIKFDLEYLDKLPGKKILLRGNHDYWWTSSRKMQDFFPHDIGFIQNNHIKIGENIYICGTRGWTVPGEKGFSQEDEKIYARELMRLRLSLDSIPRDPEREVIVLFHYPPVNLKHEYSDVIEILREYKVKTCIYGHLHDASIKLRLPEAEWGINFILASADALDFSPRLVKIIS